MRIDAIKNKVSKIRDLLEDLRDEIEDDIYDLEERENLNERQEEKYSFIKPFLFGTRLTPPMIAGMRTIFSELPENIDYVVFYSNYCDEIDNDNITQKNKKLEKENKRLKKANKRLMKILKGKAK